MRASIPLLLLALPLAYGKIVYEYGNKDSIGQPLSYFQGEMGALEKIRVVNLKVPQCHQVTYVLVEVENDRSVPTIKYEPITESVVILYHLVSNSRSTYEIWVKSAHLYGCDVPPPPSTQDGVYPKGDTGYDNSAEVVATPIRRSYGSKYVLPQGSYDP